MFILSEQSDISTTNVIEWLEFYEKNWFRLNIEDIVELNFIGDDVEFIYENQKYLLSSFSSYWYRRGAINFLNNYNTTISQFDNFIYIELNKLLEFIYYKLRHLNNINCIEYCDVNKLIVNNIARDIKIKTPVDLIFSNKEKLKPFLKIDKLLTKPIGGGAINVFSNFSTYNYSKLIKENHLNSEKFFPSLVQNYIDKKYELRIFYLKGDFYTMAIMSQLDNKTKIDFREYNKNKPNRTIPFKLPKVVEKKLDKLMKNLNLNSGSIDMIVTLDNQYVFLEVNPVGQFGMVSYPCNYNLEEKIAKYL